MPECPTFLDLPARPAKPRRSGITHVLDKGLTPEATQAFLGQAAHLIDIVKVGWGIGYVDPSLPVRVRMCAEHDSPVCLGGTLLEVAAMQDRVGELRDWALAVGISHVEVSNGLRALATERKRALVRELAADFVVLAETGAKEGNYPPTPAAWADEMARDLDAGAVWVVAEGRESGTVGLYDSDHVVREDLVKVILDRDPAGPGDLRGPHQGAAGLVRPPARRARQYRQRRAGQRPGPGNAAAGTARGYGHPAGALT